MAVLRNIVCISPKTKFSGECTATLSPDSFVPPHDVKRRCSYKALCIFLVLCLTANFYWIGHTIYQLNKTSDSDIKSCSNSSRSIWIPYMHNGSHPKMPTDSSHFYCQILDHKLSHLIDFLVITNKSTIYVPDEPQQSWAVNTRPTTPILHYRELEDPRLYIPNVARLNDKGIIILEDGSVKIQQDGVYWIYSIVTFVHTQNDTIVPKDEYYIQRKRSNVKTTVILSDKEQKKYVQTESFTSLDLSGNFFLRKGDVLNLVIRNLVSVYRFTAANYWGVYQVRPMVI